MRNARTAIVAVGVTLLTAPVVGQDVELKSESDGNLTALLAARHKLQTYALSFDPVETATSPDSVDLQVLDDATMSGENYVRAVTDLLGVYDNLQCAADRAMMKPLLEDRLRLYSGLLETDARQAALPLTTPGAVKLQATSQRALELIDELRGVKSRVDAAALSLD
jgi:hypothetical protein